jgi:hypothetical protein
MVRINSFLCLVLAETRFSHTLRLLTPPLEVLRAYQPKSCDSQPNIDFSRGFPDPWHLSFTDISVPSQHVQEGKRYDAEVVLSHVYSKNRPNKLVSSHFSFVCHVLLKVSEC